MISYTILFSANYELARRKLKEAEEISDLDSCTEQEEYLKKSRKHRAAKVVDNSSSHDEDEELEMSDFVLNLPKVPSNCSRNEIETETLKKKSILERKNVKYVKNSKGKYVQKTQINPVPSCSRYSETMDKGDSYAQRTENLHSNIECPNDVTRLIENMTRPNSNSNKEDAQCTENIYSNTDFSNDVLHSSGNVTESNLNSKQGTQYTEILHLIDGCPIDICNDNIQTLYPSENNMTGPNLNSKQLDDKYTNAQSEDLIAEILINKDSNESIICHSSNSILENNQNLKWNPRQGSQDINRFIVQKLIKIDVKTSCIEKHIKLLEQKISNNRAQPEQNKEVIDIFQDLPLKNKNELELMEVKLRENAFYRNEMIKQLTRFTCKDLRASCSHIMKQTLSNEVAIHYSWYGAKKKEHFSKLHICKVIMSVLRNSHAGVTDEDISTPLKIWLAHAKERVEREKQKKNE
ncbi:PREDICTED: uncharacterized protein LOC105460270 isoform X2 [Wasmannia auropunctata]|uniref:uncharacterized protein LOC105460270 isoform X2 n=1 Tax=Wasmannia auropunctata TaxID=64793 RepID=UPI0005EDF609|nr:PREDICTED: uncharacterized protein LOC105460270 isoform X2 [Wasmannia auropunctata]